MLALEGVWPFQRNAYAFSADGSKLAYSRRSEYANFSIARVATGGNVEHVILTSGTAKKICPALSPDGSLLAFLQDTQEGTELFFVTTNGGIPERLTFGGSVAPVCPAWSPSGQRLAFATRLGGIRMLAMIATRGGQPHVFESTKVSDAMAWAPGRRIAYQVPANQNFRLLNPETEEEQLLVQSDSIGFVFSPKFSPDGTKVVVHWNLRRGRGLWLMSPADGSHALLAEGRWIPIGWSGDGHSIYAADQGAFKRFSLVGGEGEIVSPPETVDGYCTPHERSEELVWVCKEGDSFSDVWMIENFDPEMTGRSR